MAYTPKTWQCGETIMADDLNHMEQGIEDASSGGVGAVRYINIIDYVTCDSKSTRGAITPHALLDISYQGVLDVLAEGRILCAIVNGAYYYPISIYTLEESDYYEVDFTIQNPTATASLVSMQMYCDTADGNMHLGANCWASPIISN